MLIFIGAFILITVVLFVLSIYMIKIRQRREIDVVFDAKVKKIEKKIDPYYNFLYNLFGWVLVAFVIYYIYLG